MSTLVLGAPLLAGGPPGWLIYGALAVVSVGAVGVGVYEMSKANDKADATLTTGAATDVCSTCQPPRCKDITKDMDNKNDLLKDELAKYDPAADAAGGFPHAHGVTSPGGHYKEIRDLQRGLKNSLRDWAKNKCWKNAPTTDNYIRTTAQNNVNMDIEVPPGQNFIPIN